MKLLHICLLSEWQAAQPSGKYSADSLVTEGFIHCSTLEQVLLPANRFFRGCQSLVLLVIDSNRVQAEVRFEDVGDGSVYPHIYGPLNVDAVYGVVPFPPNPDRSFSLPISDLLTI